MTTDRVGPAVAVVVESDPLRELFDTHYWAMTRLATLLLGGSAAAEDVVQDAFIAVARHLPRIDPSARAAYLRRAVINQARTTNRWHRAAKRRAVAPDDRVADPEGDALAADRRRRVVEALGRLPDRQRQCLVLRFYAGMTDPEIADHCQIAVGSVKNHLQRGRRALQDTLGDLR